jgi:hypothetical protein
MESDRMRKIEVQSPEDIRFLLENLSRCAREKIDLHLPPGAAERDDGLRKRVEEMVIEVCFVSFLSLPVKQAEEGGWVWGAINWIEFFLVWTFSTFVERLSSRDTASP